MFDFHRQYKLRGIVTFGLIYKPLGASKRVAMAEMVTGA